MTTMTIIETIQDSIIETIEEGIENFQSCDWTHEFRRDGKIIPDQYCEGGDEGCSYCAAVNDSVSEARNAAEIAIEYVRGGDIRAALRLIESAVKIEEKWGDAPAYLPALRALRALAE